MKTFILLFIFTVSAHAQNTSVGEMRFNDVRKYSLSKKKTSLYWIPAGTLLAKLHIDLQLKKTSTWKNAIEGDQCTVVANIRDWDTQAVSNYKYKKGKRAHLDWISPRGEPFSYTREKIWTEENSFIFSGTRSKYGLPLIIHCKSDLTLQEISDDLQQAYGAPVVEFSMNKSGYFSF